MVSSLAWNWLQKQMRACDNEVFKATCSWWIIPWQTLPFCPICGPAVCRLTLTTFGVYTSCSHLMFTQWRPPPAPFVKSEPELLPVPSEVVKHIPLQRCSTPLNQQFELWYSQLSWICENTSRRHRSDKGSRGREWRKSKNILIFSIKKCHLLQL